MNYRFGIAHFGKEELGGFVFDLAGCATTAPDMASLRELLPVAIAEHVSWLVRHGEDVDGHDIEIDGVEEVDAVQTGAADGEFVFEHDTLPIEADAVETAVRHMNYATGDLVALIQALPDQVLDWQPPRSAMAKVDVWQLEAKTIREIARELPGGERYYRLGLWEGEMSLGPESEVFDRKLQREQTIARLRSLTEEERGKTFFVTRPWQDRPEQWTARKTIRRLISHERFHTKEIEQRLAWLLLGVPEFRVPVGASVEGDTSHD